MSDWSKLVGLEQVLSDWSKFLLRRRNTSPAEMAELRGFASISNEKSRHIGGSSHPDAVVSGPVRRH
jgi:hypothetical protein